MRPDGAARVSLANRGTETTVDDLKTLYKLMTYFQATEEVCIVIKPIDLNMSTHVVSYMVTVVGQTPRGCDHRKGS